MNRALLNHSKDDWGTPPEVFDPLHAYFGFDFDAAANAENAKLPVFISPEMDCLTYEWSRLGKTAWMNPPYGRGIEKFLTKAAGETHFGVTTVALVPARVGSSWWRWCAPPEVYFLSQRVKFVGAPDPAPFDSAVLVYRPPFPLLSQRWSPVR